MDENSAGFRILNAANLQVPGIPKWKDLCNQWGNGLVNAGRTISQGIALGLGLDINFFNEKMELAPHLLAPTATDMNEYGKKNEIIAGYHYG